MDVGRQRSIFNSREGGAGQTFVIFLLSSLSPFIVQCEHAVPHQHVLSVR